MKLFVLPCLVLGTLLLTSCTSNHTTEIIPQKTFQYSYQEPSRVLAPPELAKQLSSGKTGRNVNIKLKDKSNSSARLGPHYYSANGHMCRKYTLRSSFEYAACNIDGRWYQASPIIINKQN